MPSAAILIFGGAQEVDELVLGCVAMRREARSLQHESKSLALGSGPAFRHDAGALGQVSLWSNVTDVADWFADIGYCSPT